MAKMRQQVKKRRIVITKGQERGGDIRFGGGELRVRLTPKLMLAAALLVTATVVIVIYGAREAARMGPVSAPAPLPQPAVSLQPAAPGEESVKPPVLSNASIVPAEPNASTALDLQYIASDPKGLAISYAVRWFVNSRQIQESNASTLLPGTYKKGDVVYAEVVPSNYAATGAAFQTQPVTVGNAPPSISSVTLTPDTASVGTALTAMPTAVDPDGDVVTYSYQWRVNNAPAQTPENQATFDTSQLHKGDGVSVEVTATDGSIKTMPLLSNTIILQNRPPEITSTAPSDVVNGVYTYRVTARDPDGDQVRFRLDQFPQGMNIDPSGLIRWELPRGVMYTGRNEIPVTVVADDGDGGTATQSFSIVLTDYIAN